ncbi:MAG: hypothetical protein JW924_08370 [Fusobacteriaceae bacterium]|nr:hypothetical protein [Fusobacteriaceae bacterium]
MKTEEIQNKIKIGIVIWLSFLLIVGLINGIVEFIHNIMNPTIVVNKNEKIYKGTYKGRIDEKYPQAMKNVEIAREELLKAIKTKKIYKKDSDHLVGEYYDKNGRLIFHSNHSLGYMRMAIQRYQRHMPIEEGTLYDEKGRVYKRVRLTRGLTYFTESPSDKDLFSFVKNITYNCEIEETKYLENDRKIEHSTEISISSQYYKEIVKEYKNNILISEKIIEDKESDYGFIIATVEKKYNEKGELIYKTVERKDKTNSCRSFTEMNFAKDEIVTKYYKGKDVFATVTENLVGPVEIIEKIQMVNGEKVKKVYKNKVKAIVKRQKVGEPLKIVDVIEYLKKDRINHEKYGTTDMLCTRYIFDDKGNLQYRIRGVMGWYSTYLFHESSNLPSDMNKGYLQEMFYVFIKNDGFYKYFSKKRLDEELDILKFDLNENQFKNLTLKGNSQDKFNEFLKISLGEVTDKKYKIKNIEIKEIKTLEELLNGYKYE